jgi:hypothetical protein
MILVSCRWNSTSAASRESVQHFCQTMRRTVLRCHATCDITMIDRTDNFEIGHQLTPVGESCRMVD